MPACESSWWRAWRILLFKGLPISRPILVVRYAANSTLLRSRKDVGSQRVVKTKSTGEGEFNQLDVEYDLFLSFWKPYRRYLMRQFSVAKKIRCLNRAIIMHCLGVLSISFSCSRVCTLRSHIYISLSNHVTMFALEPRLFFALELLSYICDIYLFPWYRKNISWKSFISFCESDVVNWPVMLMWSSLAVTTVPIP